MNLPAAVLLLPRTLLIALGLVSGLFGAQDSKLPLPSPADQKKAEAEVRSLFKEDFARKDRESRRTLSRKLLALAADEKNTPASRYVVLVLSGDLAVEGFDLPAALSTAEQIEKFYAVDKPPLAGATFTATTFAVKAQVLNNAQRFAQSQDDVVTLGGAYLKLSEDALKERGFDDALPI